MTKYKHKVMIIEDEEHLRKNFFSYLTMFYEEVFEAGNGMDALKIYNDKKPDILLVDINLPKMNGIEFIKKIREKDLNTKIIILSACSDKDYLLEANSLKLIKYLVKPIDRKELKEAFLLANKELEEYIFYNKKIIKLGELCMYDRDLKILKIDNNEINLTLNEQKLLEMFIDNKNRVIKYDEISNYVYNGEYNIDVIKNQIRRLRKKLPESIIENLSSVGYKLNC